MRILIMHIVDSPDQFGGTEKNHVIQVSERLSREKDIDLRVAVNSGMVYQQLFEMGVRTVRLPDKGVPHIPRFQKILWNTIRDFRPDLIHSHHRYTTVLCSLWPFRRYKILHTFHVEQFNKKWNPFYGDHATAVSQGVKTHFIRDFDLKDRFITVIYNGLESRYWEEGNGPDEAPIVKRNGEVTAVIVARLVEQKGHDTLIRAVSLLPDDVKRRFKAICVGDGEMRHELEYLSHQQGLDKQILFVGHQTDVRPYLYSADFVVQPSKWEGFGTTILEAYLCGKPVIGSRVGGIPEIIRHGETGLLFDPVDPQSLAEAILRFMRDPGLQNRCGEAGRKYVQGKFSLEKMVTQYKRLYKSLLEGRKRENHVAVSEH